MTQDSDNVAADAPVPLWQFVLRLLLVLAQLALVYCLAGPRDLFFYQGF